MSKKGRKSMLKISETDLAIYLLDKLVSESGEKVSCRKVWGDPDFIEYTGFSHIHDNEKPVSVGTMRHWLNVKKYNIPILTDQEGYLMNLSEITLYKYHKYVTGRINSNKSFQEFSRIKNKNYGEKRIIRDGKLKTSQNILNDIAKELELSLRVSDFSNNLSEFREFLIFMYGEDEYENSYNEVIKQYK